MIRALILCALVAVVGVADSKTFTATATLPSPLEQRIIELEKRVEELEKKAKGGMSVTGPVKTGICYSTNPPSCEAPEINPHPFGLEPEK